MKLPLQVVEVSTGTDYGMSQPSLVITDADGMYVTSLVDEAAEIVRRVNAFDELVAASSELIVSVELWEDAVRSIIECSPNRGMKLDRLKAALAAAKEPT